MPLLSHLRSVLSRPIVLIILKLIRTGNLPETCTSTIFGFVRILSGHELICTVELAKFIIDFLYYSLFNSSIHIKMQQQISFEHPQTLEYITTTRCGTSMSVDAGIFEIFVIKIDLIFFHSLLIQALVSIPGGLMDERFPYQFVFAVLIHELLQFHEVLRIRFQSDLLPRFHGYFSLLLDFTLACESSSLISLK